MGRPSKYSSAVRERAVRLVFEHQDEHESQGALVFVDAGGLYRHYERAAA